MRLVKNLKLLLLIGLGLTTSQAVAQQQNRQETSFDRQLRERDDQPLREFVQSKENIDIKKKANNLEISGDVRFEYTTLREKGICLFRNEASSSPSYPSSSSFSSSSISGEQSDIFEVYRHLRGGNHVDSRSIPVSTNDFDVEFNFKVKYTFKKAWCMAHLQFDNPAGIRGNNDCIGTFPVFNRNGSRALIPITRNSRAAGKGSGDANSISLKRAYIGYNVWADGKHRLDIEVGRRKLDDLFDSEIQFSNRFDGIIFKYASSIDKISDWYCNTGLFVIDERKNHFGWVTEIGLLNVFDSGLDVKYSYIDWTKRGRNRCFERDPLGNEFQNSQLTLEYNFLPSVYDYSIPVQLYGAVLTNHAAKKNHFTRGKKKNLGWYAGTYIGAVDEQGDWSIDIEYIYIQAQAVPDFDVGSIGRGNILNENLYDVLNESLSSLVSDFDSSSSPSYSLSGLEGYFPSRGNANFKGWRFEFLYALTDNLSIDFMFETSTEEDRRIGGPHKYNAFEIETVYAF